MRGCLVLAEARSRRGLQWSVGRPIGNPTWEKAQPPPSRLLHAPKKSTSNHARFRVVRSNNAARVLWSAIRFGITSTENGAQKKRQMLAERLQEKTTALEQKRNQNGCQLFSQRYCDNPLKAMSSHNIQFAVGSEPISNWAELWSISSGEHLCNFPGMQSHSKRFPRKQPIFLIKAFGHIICLTFWKIGPFIHNETQNAT